MSIRLLNASQIWKTYRENFTTYTKQVSIVRTRPIYTIRHPYEVFSRNTLAYIKYNYIPVYIEH